MQFRERLESGRFLYTCEVDPPKVPRLEVTLRRLKPFADRLDALSVADNPLATLRMDALACSALLCQRLGRPVVMHVTARDFSLLALHSRLLGAWAVGVRSVLLMTGDPIRIGTFSSAKPVYPTNSVGLVKLVREMNRGRTSTFEPMRASTDFFAGVVANPHASNLRAEVDRLARKRDAGARFVKTQPVFDMRTLDRFLEAAEPVGLPILLGIMPLTSLAFAHHVAEKVPEVFVPDRILKVLRKTDTTAAGVDLARTFMEAARDSVRGFHFFPMSKYGLLAELLDEDEGGE